MEIIYLDKETYRGRETVIGLGNFDGIHKGHRSLIERARELGQALSTKSALLLFTDHTGTILSGDDRGYLTSIDDKLELVRCLGVEVVFILEFSKEVSQLEPKDFIDNIIKSSCKSAAIVVGRDYRYGHRARGDVDRLQSYANQFKLSLSVIDDFLIDDKIVSSTEIKELIREGKVEKASYLLARPYSVKGRVIAGEGRGRTLGFPTANLVLDYDYIIPKEGVYGCKVRIGGEEYYALTSIGTNPTFGGMEGKIETYILDFDRDIYGECLELLFIEKLRDNIRFSSKEALIDQMAEDRDYIKGSVEDENSVYWLDIKG